MTRNTFIKAITLGTAAIVAGVRATKAIYTEEIEAAIACALIHEGTLEMVIDDKYNDLGNIEDWKAYGRHD